MSQAGAHCTVLIGQVHVVIELRSLSSLAPHCVAKHTSFVRLCLRPVSSLVVGSSLCPRQVANNLSPYALAFPTPHQHMSRHGNSDLPSSSSSSMCQSSTITGYYSSSFRSSSPTNLVNGPTTTGYDGSDLRSRAPTSVVGDCHTSGSASR